MLVKLKKAGKHTMGLLFFDLLLAITISFLRSILEAGILSITSSYSESKNAEKPKTKQTIK